MNPVVDATGSVAGVLAIIGTAIATPLYISGFRDLQRLRDWRELEPERGDPDPFAPLLDESAAASPAPRTGTTSEVARRVTSERPALDRTSEYPALILDSADSALGARLPQPQRPLVFAAFSVTALIVISLIVIGLLTGHDNAASPNTPDYSGVEVAVLDGTTNPDPELPAQLGIDIDELGFDPGQLGVLLAQDRTVVEFEDGFAEEATALADGLNVETKPVPMETTPRSQAGGADLAVIIGDDRVKKK